MKGVHLQSYIKAIKKKFFSLTLLGVLFTGVISYLALDFHQKAIDDFKKLNTLKKKYSNIQSFSKEILLDFQKLNLFEANRKLVEERTHIEIIQKIKNKNLALIEDIDVIKKLVNKRLFKSQKNIFKKVDLGGSLDVFTTELNSLKNNILSSQEIMDKGDVLNASKENIDLSIGVLRGSLSLKEKILVDRLEDIGFYLVVLSILQVILIWIIIFRPMYSTLLNQHERIYDSVLEAESANRSKTDFLANVSHEIRTPMTAILGYIELIQDEKYQGKTKEEVFQIIKDNSNHLLGLIDEILEISKIESGNLVINKTEVDLNDIFNKVYNLLKFKTYKKNIELIFTYENDIPEKIITDPKRLKQILFNLIGNAIKFTSHGSVTVNTKFDSKKKSLKIYIIDTGIGIKKEHLRKLFQPFSQADNSVSRKYGGTGLGLILSRLIAQEMNGDIKIIKSEVNQGTTFEVSFSNIAVGNKFISDFNDEVTIDPDEHSKRKDLTDMDILVVDDAKENTVLFKMYLEEAGADVEICFSGIDALKKVEEKRFDIILLDLQMPEKDGYQTIHELRMKDFDRPIIALTAHAFEEEKEKTKRHGFDDHITKPVDKDYLVKRIIKHFRE